MTNVYLLIRWIYKIYLPMMNYINPLKFSVPYYVIALLCYISTLATASNWSARGSCRYLHFTLTRFDTFNIQAFVFNELPPKYIRESFFGGNSSHHWGIGDYSCVPMMIATCVPMMIASCVPMMIASCVPIMIVSILYKKNCLFTTWIPDEIPHFTFGVECSVFPPLPSYLYYL